MNAATLVAAAPGTVVVRPFADAAWSYRRAGWEGTLPLPPKKKSPPPTGWTGRLAPAPSGADVQAWIDDLGETPANIGLRLPEDVLGIDVDAYAGKPGARTLDALVGKYGPLPATWTSTARPGTRSGIRFYRIPVGLAWPGELGPGIETVRHGHRYAVVGPSVHPTGRSYGWVSPAGEACDTPRVDELPELPQAWVVGITGGVAETAALARADMTAPDVEAWLSTTCAAGAACSNVQRSMTAARGRLGSGVSRHEVALHSVMHLIRLGGEGHVGVIEALAELREEFIARVVGEGDGARSHGEAEAEWARMVQGGVAKAAMLHPAPALGDPCGAAPAPVLEALNKAEDATEAAVPDELGEDESPTSATPPREPEVAPAEGEDGHAALLEAYDAIFGASPTLGKIRQAATARMVSPVALLACVLARVATETPQCAVLPGVVGSVAPLNFGVALVGASGSTKSSTVDVSRELLPHRPVMVVQIAGTPGAPAPGTTAAGATVVVLDQDADVEKQVGSGEGLVNSFLTWDSAKKRNVLADDPRRLLIVDEIDTLGGMQARSGATIAPILRSALTGGALGQENASAERRRHVPRGSYRLALIAGVQPTRAGVLLDDADAGTPQRLLWAPTADPTLDPGVSAATEFPGELGWTLPEPLGGIALGLIDPTTLPNGQVVIDYPEEIKAIVRQTRADQARGVMDDPLAGHRNLTRLKVSALLALLHGMTEITTDWWETAGRVLAFSDAAVGSCRGEIAKVDREARDRKAKQAGRAQVVTESVVAQAGVQLASRSLLRIVQSAGGDGVSWAKARGKLAARVRPFADEARELLESTGQISVEEVLYQSQAGRVLKARGLS